MKKICRIAADNLFIRLFQICTDINANIRKAVVHQFSGNVRDIFRFAKQGQCFCVAPDMADDGGSLAVAADQMNIGPGFPDCIQKVDRRGDAAE